MKKYNLTILEASFVAGIIILGLFVFEAFLSTYRSIPQEAAFELATSLALISVGLGFLLKKTWTKAVYSVLFVLSLLFFLSAFIGFDGVIPEEMLGLFIVALLVRIVPAVACLGFWRVVKRRFNT